MIKGILTFVAIIGITTIWALGWTSLCWLVGASMDLKISTAVLLGALLGPLGLVAVVSLGTLERRKISGIREIPIHAESRTSNPFS